MSVPLVFLDLDGTLTDPREGILDSFRHAFRAVGAPTPTDDDLLHLIGPPLVHSFRQAFPDDPGRAGLAVQAYRTRYDAHGWRANALIPGVSEALASLVQAGCQCHVVTSKLERFAVRIADHFGLRGGVGRVFGSDEAGLRADKAALITHALDALDGDPERAVMVGDRHHDIAGARTCGVASIGVTWGFGDRQELAAAGATRIVARPEALVGACLELLGATGRHLGSSS